MTTVPVKAPECRWEFPKSGGGQLYGLNNAGVALFSADTVWSFTRETIQNSVDAVRDRTKPVLVSFSLKQVTRDQVPGVDQLRAHVDRARSDVKASMATHFDENGRQVFDDALAILGRAQIPVLACSDSNTTGLEGSEQDREGAWVRLIRRQGSPAMHGAGGGSYGIGQMAPFAASIARTVFYGTRTASGQRFIGKSIWCSVSDGDDSLQHIGFYGSKATIGRAPLDRADWLPAFAQRKEIGTDIFVIGFRDDGGWDGAVLDAVLTNFFAAIHRRKLVVRVGETQIDDQTISKVLDLRIKARSADARTVAEKSEIRRTLDATRVYLKALATKPMTASIPRLGEVHLYVARDDAGPDRVAHTRSPLMLVHDRKFPVLTKYGAVFVCESEAGNTLLREYETPEHNSWTKKVTGREQVITNVNQFIREKLESLSTESTGEEDVRELAEYLPEELPSVSGQALSLKVKQKKSEKESGARKPREGTVTVRAERPPRRRTHQVEAEATESDDFEGDGGSGNGAGGAGGTSGGENPGAGSGPHGKAGEGKLRRLGDGELGFRSWFADGATEIVISSRRTGEAHAMFRRVGEDGDFPLEGVVTNQDGSAVERDAEGRYLIRFDVPGVARLRLRNERRVSLSLEVG